jgi:hypothetical protein
MIKTEEKFDKSTLTYVCVKICIFYMPVFMDIYVYIYTVEHIRVCIFK